MTETIVSVFERLADAEAARAALFGAGFPASAIRLRTRGDVIGAHTDAATATVERLVRSLGGAGAGAGRNLPRALYRLSVEGHDPVQLARAAEILRGCGAAGIAPAS